MTLHYESIDYSPSLIAIQGGHVPPPAQEKGAVAAGQLDSPQRACALGEPVPIVFGRFRNNAGGILVSPGASECRFENDTSNAVTAYYALVVSEGKLSDIAVKDVFQRSCRVGSHSQIFGYRAGTWKPGNFIVERAGKPKPEASHYCGTAGTYKDITTVSFKVTIPDGFDFWNRQVHLFIRGGMHVTRLIDNVFGPSDNFADLVYWMLSSSQRLPAEVIDKEGLTKAAKFLEKNAFTCNINIQESANYANFVAQRAPYFLLCSSNENGRKGLRPVLPVRKDGSIDTDLVIPWAIFTEEQILPGSVDIKYNSLSDRQPFVAQMIWRQQLQDDFGILRTAEVRMYGTAENGPFESHDLSEFCTNENHAVKVGAYILAKRMLSTHTIAFSVVPSTSYGILPPGSPIEVTLTREADGGLPARYTQMYLVERVTKQITGEVQYECSMIPLNADGQNRIAVYVANAKGSGVLLTNNRTGVSCDANNHTDETIPPPDHLPTPDPAHPLPFPPDSLPGGGVDGGLLPPDGGNPSGNPGYPDSVLPPDKEPPEPPEGPKPPFMPGLSPGERPGPGQPVIPCVPDPCPDKRIKWFKIPPGQPPEEFNNFGSGVVVLGELDIQVDGERVMAIIYCAGQKKGSFVTPPYEPSKYPHLYSYRFTINGAPSNSPHIVNSVSWGYPPKVKEGTKADGSPVWTVVAYNGAPGIPNEVQLISTTVGAPAIDVTEIISPDESIPPKCPPDHPGAGP